MKKSLTLALLMGTTALAACGGGGSGSGPAPTIINDPADTAQWSSWSSWTPSSGPADQEKLTQMRERSCEVTVNGKPDSVSPSCEGSADEMRIINNPNYIPGNDGGSDGGGTTPIMDKPDTIVYGAWTDTGESNAVAVGTDTSYGEWINQAPSDTSSLKVMFTRSKTVTTTYKNTKEQSRTYEIIVNGVADAVAPTVGQLTRTVDLPSSAVVNTGSESELRDNPNFVNPADTASFADWVLGTVTYGGTYKDFTPYESQNVWQNSDPTNTTSPQVLFVMQKFHDVYNGQGMRIDTRTCELTVNGLQDLNMPSCTGNYGQTIHVGDMESRTIEHPEIPDVKITTGAFDLLSEMRDNPNYDLNDDTWVRTFSFQGTPFVDNLNPVYGEWSAWSPETGPEAESTLEQERSRSVDFKQYRYDHYTYIQMDGGDGVLDTVDEEHLGPKPANDKDTIELGLVAQADQVESQTVLNPAFVDILDEYSAWADQPNQTYAPVPFNVYKNKTVVSDETNVEVIDGTAYNIHVQVWSIDEVTPSYSENVLQYRERTAVNRVEDESDQGIGAQDLTRSVAVNHAEVLVQTITGSQDQQTIGGETIYNYTKTPYIGNTMPNDPADEWTFVGQTFADSDPLEVRNAGEVVSVKSSDFVAPTSGANPALADQPTITIHVPVTYNNSQPREKKQVMSAALIQNGLADLVTPAQPADQEKWVAHTPEALADTTVIEPFVVANESYIAPASGFFVETGVGDKNGDGDILDKGTWSSPAGSYEKTYTVTTDVSAATDHIGIINQKTQYETDTAAINYIEANFTGSQMNCLIDAVLDGDPLSAGACGTFSVQGTKYTNATVQPTASDTYDSTTGYYTNSDNKIIATGAVDTGTYTITDSEYTATGLGQDLKDAHTAGWTGKGVEISTFSWSGSTDVLADIAPGAEVSSYNPFNNNDGDIIITGTSNGTTSNSYAGKLAVFDETTYGASDKSQFTGRLMLTPNSAAQARVGGSAAIIMHKFGTDENNTAAIIRNNWGSDSDLTGSEFASAMSPVLADLN